MVTALYNCGVQDQLKGEFRAQTVCLLPSLQMDQLLVLLLVVLYGTATTSKVNFPIAAW